MYKVESKEENGEGSAWLARSGAPVKVGNREENGEGSAWPLCSGLPLSREKGGWKPREARENPSSVFFRKISPTGLAIPFSRLRVSPAPETAHLLRLPFREAVPLLGNRTAQCCVRIAPPSWRGATPTLNYVEPESTGLSFLSWRV